MSSVGNYPSKPVLGIPRIKVSVGEPRVEHEVFIPVIFNQTFFPVENLDTDWDPLLDVKTDDASITIIAIPGISWKDKLQGLYPPPIDHSLLASSVFELPRP